MSSLDHIMIIPEGRQTLSLATKMQNLGKYYDQTPRKRCPIEEDPDETEDMLDGRRNGHARHGYYDKPDSKLGRVLHQTS